MPNPQRPPIYGRPGTDVGRHMTPKQLEDIFMVKECFINQEVVTCVLEPKSDESFLKHASIKLIGDELSSLIYIDSFEQKVTLDFTSVSWDRISDKDFILEIPEGIDVVNH